MILFKSKRFRSYFFLFLFLGGLIFLFLNSQGVIKYLKLKDEVNEIKLQTKKVEEENKKLEDEIDSLNKKIPAKIERTAREKHDMLREGEKAIKVEEK
ncbi:MAG TPA: septum formation initiator family protein [Ignavibacteriaceae bacterium]|nr:septum formation initiator family protein [Ignavibacteriaceae bacterium]